MASLGLQVANDIANGVLTFYQRSEAIWQTMYRKPLLGWLRSGSQTFPGGKDYVSEPVQIAAMSDTPGFLQGYSEDDQLAFLQAANLLRAQYPWKEVHAGLIITWTELKKDGITINDDQKQSEHSQVALIRLTSLLKNRINDFGESYARATNNMFWQDGSQDPKQVPGIFSLLPDNPAAVIGGIDATVYLLWQHRVKLGIVASEQNQTLCKTLRKELIQLGRYEGNPNKAFCGSDFLDALFIEIQSKGLYTMEGFTKKMDMGMRKVSMAGLGEFEYDPTLDLLGKSKYCYIMDSRRIRMRPMEGEDNKVLMPTRPYNYMVFLKDMTWTGAIERTQGNANGVYSVA